MNLLKQSKIVHKKEEMATHLSITNCYIFQLIYERRILLITKTKKKFYYFLLLYAKLCEQNTSCVLNEYHHHAEWCMDCIIK